MTIDKSRRRLPPYISYRTFDNFIGRLQQQVPSRIDRSYWGETLSGSTGTQLMSALRFLNLVDANGKRSTAGVPSTSYIDMLLAEVMALRANLRLVEAQAKVKMLEDK